MLGMKNHFDISDSIEIREVDIKGVACNLILNHFHAKLKGKQLWNQAKFKLIRKRKNELTNGHGRMII